MNFLKTLGILLLLSASLMGTSYAAEDEAEVYQAEEQDRAMTYRAPQIDVIGAGSDALVSIPGSGVVKDQKTLDFEQPASVQQAVRNIPGVNVRGEDSAGLITNIGVRGLSPDRSEKILILEDGFFAGLAPYIENAAYYTPPIERMQRLELLKGSGSILWGPQTVGGVLNLITPPIPKDYNARVRLDGGNEGYVLGLGQFGKTWGPFGLNLDILYKRGNGWTRRDENFNLGNVTGKMIFKIGEKTNILLKNNYQNQNSHQSYLGLTTGLFSQDPRLNPVPLDEYNLMRYDGQLTVQHFFTESIEFITRMYYWYAQRNWNRQDFSRNTDFAPPPFNTASIIGNQAVNGGAIYLLESFLSRDRSFQGAGVEPRLHIDYDAFGQRHQMYTGVRFHFETMLNARDSRSTFDADPFIREQDRRSAYTFAFFFQNIFQVTDDLRVIPGFRLEHYTQKRHITVEQFTPVDIEGQTTMTVPIPGLGITYQMPGNSTLFTGIHRGFAPPRVSQAVDASGQDLDLDPELSWNFEFGVRTNPVPAWQSEATFFLMDFSNQVVPASDSGGASNLLANAGQTRHIGAEFASSLDLLGLAGFDGSQQLILDTRYTFVDARNTTPGGIFEGNVLPYAPMHNLVLGARYYAKDGVAKGLSLGLEGQYVSSQFADQANTVTPSADGTVGEIPAYWLMNAYFEYLVPKTRLRLNLVANNILNNTYIASRAPQGIFPGGGIQVIGGLQYDFFPAKAAVSN